MEDETLTNILNLLQGNNVNNKQTNPINTNTSNNTDSKNEVKQNNVNNTTTENTTLNNTSNTISNNTVNNTQDDNKVNEEVKLTDEQKAVDLAKKYFGITDGVYYKVEQTQGNGIYIVSVRDSETTKAIEWYTINVNNGEVQ